MGAAIFIVFVGCAVVCAWMAIRSQRELRRRMDLQAALQPGDEVMTTSGIYGTVHQLDAAHVWLEVAPGTVVKVALRAVASKVDDAAPARIVDDRTERGEGSAA
jgi:preprotein translocase subunit YajC